MTDGLVILMYMADVFICFFSDQAYEKRKIDIPLIAYLRLMRELKLYRTSSLPESIPIINDKSSFLSTISS